MRCILDIQNRNLRSLNEKRIIRDGYEYRILHFGGIAQYMAIDCRKTGKKKFRYFGGISAAHCLTTDDAMQLIMDKIEKGEMK